MQHTREALRRQFSPWVLVFWMVLLAALQTYEVLTHEPPPISARDEQ